MEVRHAMRTARRSLALLAGQHRLSPEIAFAPRQFDPEFVGINVAGSGESRTTRYVLQQLQQLGISQVRTDLRQETRQGETLAANEAFAEALLDHGCSVLLRLVQPPEQARAMASSDRARKSWSAFVRRCAPLAHRCRAVEIGSVPNRKKWSGYRHRDYREAWRIARSQLDGVSLIGPNVSDFEPLHSIPLLAATEPDWHSNNLFTERTRHPEAFDARALGKTLAPHLRLNLVKKARIMQQLGAQAGCRGTLCTHTCWNALRVARWVPETEVEPLRAALMLRYLLLAWASGALERVYWGPLIGYPDGLIYDDPEPRVPPERERVAWYPPVLPEVAHYRVTPSARALAHLMQRFANATCTGIETEPHYSFYFHQPGRDTIWSIHWAAPEQGRPEPHLPQASAWFDQEGQEISAPQRLGEIPVYACAAASSLNTPTRSPEAK